MTDAAGGFYSTQDADSEGVEGKFFVWTPDEITESLGEEDARAFCHYYDVTEDGNFEEKNILNVKHSVAESASALGISDPELIQILERGREKLFMARESRIKPFRDEKVLTAWNGLMLAAFAEAGAALERKDYLGIAERNAGFVLASLRKDGLLLRTSKDGASKLNAYLEDYACYADGLIELFQATGNIRWLKEARALADKMIEEFWDEDNGGFFFTGRSHEELVVQTKDYYDNATPSGNSVAADVCLKLAKFYADDRYERFAVTVLRLVAGQMRRFPQAFGRALSAMELHLSPVKEVVVVGDLQRRLAKVVHSRYLPSKIVVIADDPASVVELPHLAGKEPIGSMPTVYVCESYTCQRPVTDEAGMVTLLSK
jgi:hypothetical protein